MNTTQAIDKIEQKYCELMGLERKKYMTISGYKRLVLIFVWVNQNCRDKNRYGIMIIAAVKLSFRFYPH